MNDCPTRAVPFKRLVLAVSSAVAVGVMAAGCSSSSDPVGGMDPVLDTWAVTSDNRLIRFASAQPTVFQEVGDLASPVVGLDFRPATNDLFALFADGVLATLDPMTGEVLETITTQVAMGDPLEGAVDIDFNPAANALRIVGSGTRNLRLGPAVLEPSSNMAAIEDLIFGYRIGAGDTAYSNNAATGQGTTHFFIDAQAQVFATQASNPGLVTRVGDLFDGITPTDAEATVRGYDIFQPVSGAMNEHYAVFTRDGDTSLWTIDPETGAANPSLALDGVVNGMVVDLSVTGTMNPDEREFVFLVDTDSGQEIVALVLDLDSNDPGTPETFTVMGLEEGDRLVSIDFRTTAADDMLNGLWALGVNGTQGRLYRLEKTGTDAQATAVGVLRTNTTGDAVPVVLQGERFRMDFNPAVDLLRVLSDSGQNLRINPDEGRMVADEVRPAGFTFIDGTTRWANVNVPTVVNVAYRPAPEQLMGEVPSLDFQYVVDTRGDTSRLARVIVPNDGALVEVGDLGVGALRPGQHGFDITQQNRAIAALTLSGADQTTLFTIDLMTGEATEVGVIGDGSFRVNAISATTE